MHRRHLAAGAVLGALGLVGLSIGPASALAPSSVNHTATCALTSYTFTGSFGRLSSALPFNLHASGSCLGTSTGVNLDLNFVNSVGPFSCVDGVATGGGYITPNNGGNVGVSAVLVNTGGEYVVTVYLAGVAVGNITTLPVACELGQTQTTISGTGTLTFTA